MHLRQSVETTRRFLIVGSAFAALVVAACTKETKETRETRETSQKGDASGSPTPRSDDVRNTNDGSPNAVLSPSLSAGPLSEKPNQDGGENLSFTMLTNLEMVKYCLPYPSRYMEEDTRERWEHGRHLFVQRATNAKLDMRGWCSETPLKELYEKDRARVMKEHPGATFALNVFHSDSYVLSWKVGKRIYYGKVWSSKDDKECFVGATFDYDESERITFDQIVSKVARTDPTCPP